MCFDFELKKCTNCKLMKGFGDFSRKCIKQDGNIRYESQCKVCKKEKDRVRNAKTKKAEKIKKHNGNETEFTYVFSLAKEGADLKGAIDICMNQLRHQQKALRVFQQ